MNRIEICRTFTTHFIKGKVFNYFYEYWPHLDCPFEVWENGSSRECGFSIEEFKRYSHITSIDNDTIRDRIIIKWQQ